MKLLGWDNAPIYQCGCGNKACLDNYLSGRGFEMLYQDLKGETLSARKIIDLFYQSNESAVDFVNLLLSWRRFLLAISLRHLILI